MEYDVVIVGGSLSGTASAILLRRECPNLRVLVIERSISFGRRVGEATVEVSGYFLGRILGLSAFLNDTQLVKQGMRFWFANEQTTSLSDSSEIGPLYHVRLPSWQLDRAVVDQELLDRAVSAGVELLRPAQVTRVELNPGAEQVVTVREAGETRQIRCRWIIDASGVAAVLARQEGWFQPNTAHPTAAAWARWRNVKDWDARDLAERFPEWSAACFGTRNTATNHVLGHGWWSWWIPLKGGDVSVGVVFDQRLVDFPKGEGSVGDRLKMFLSRHPVGREMLAEAECVDGDAHWRKNLAYVSNTFAGDGFGLVGDAAAFLDPLYSPGMDWITFTVSATVELVASQQRGELNETLLCEHNARFARSYHRWFEAIYEDKYEYIGDYELMRIAFRLDLGFYYLGVVSQPFKLGPSALRIPPFVPAVSTAVFWIMRGYNRRFAAIARERRRRQCWGRRNTAERFLFPGFSISPSDSRLLVLVLLQWVWIELTEGWRTWFAEHRAAPAAAPAAEEMPPSAAAAS